MFVNRYVNRKCVMWFPGKKSFKVTPNPPNLTVLFDEFFGLNNKRVRRANNGRRHCPSRPQNSNGSVPVFFWSSFDLKSSFWVFWNGFVMKKFDRKCWPRSCFQDFLSFSVKWPCYSQLDSMKQFCFDEFFLSRNSNKPRIQIFWKNTADWWQILSFYNNCGAFVA